MQSSSSADVGANAGFDRRHSKNTSSPLSLPSSSPRKALFVSKEEPGHRKTPSVSDSFNPSHSKHPSTDSADSSLSVFSNWSAIRHRSLAPSLQGRQSLISQYSPVIEHVNHIRVVRPQPCSVTESSSRMSKLGVSPTEFWAASPSDDDSIGSSSQHQSKIPAPANAASSSSPSGLSIQKIRQSTEQLQNILGEMKALRRSSASSHNTVGVASSPETGSPKVPRDPSRLAQKTNAERMPSESGHKLDALESSEPSEKPVPALRVPQKSQSRLAIHTRSQSLPGETHCINQSITSPLPQPPVELPEIGRGMQLDSDTPAPHFLPHSETTGSSVISSPTRHTRNETQKSWFHKSSCTTEGPLSSWHGYSSASPQGAIAQPPPHRLQFRPPISIVPEESSSAEYSSTESYETAHSGSDTDETRRHSSQISPAKSGAHDTWPESPVASSSVTGSHTASQETYAVGQSPMTFSRQMSEPSRMPSDASSRYSSHAATVVGSQVTLPRIPSSTTQSLDPVDSSYGSQQTLKHSRSQSSPVLSHFPKNEIASAMAQLAKNKVRLAKHAEQGSDSVEPKSYHGTERSRHMKRSFTANDLYQTKPERTSRSQPSMDSTRSLQTMFSSGEQMQDDHDPETCNADPESSELPLSNGRRSNSSHNVKKALDNSGSRNPDFSQNNTSKPVHLEPERLTRPPETPDYYTRKLSQMKTSEETPRVTSQSFSQENVRRLFELADSTLQIDQLDIPPKERFLLEKFVDALSKLSVEIKLDDSKRGEGCRRLQNALSAIEGWI